MLGRSVGEQVPLSDLTEFVTGGDRLHDDSSLEKGRFTVVSVIAKRGDNTLSVDVAPVVHEPSRSWNGKHFVRDKIREEGRGLEKLTFGKEVDTNK